MCPNLRKCMDAITASNLMDERRAVMVFLMFVKRFGEHVRGLEGWWMYVEGLPEVLDTPVFFNGESEEMALLEGTPVMGAVVSKLGKLFHEYRALRNALAILDGGEVGDGDADLPILTFDVFKWADGIFWSRVLSFKSASSSSSQKDGHDLHLIPFIDFANHSLTPQLRWQVSPAGDCELRTVSDDPIKAGDELFISYGEKPNVELLFIHGFTLPSNPFDSITFPAPILESGAEEDHLQKIVTTKLRFMKHLSLTPMVHLRLSPSPSDSRDPWDSPLEGLTNARIPTSSLFTCIVSVMTLEDGILPVHDERDGFTVCGEEVASLRSFWTVISNHPMFDILLLRVWTVLLNIVQGRLGELDGEVEEMRVSVQGGVSVVGEGEVSGRCAQVKMMRRGHAVLLTEAMGWLGDLQEMFAGKESVVAYLNGVDQHRYVLTKDGRFECFDGEKTIEFRAVNDDYCDCRDGSDEPDPECCDGTDEYDGRVACGNTCDEAGRIAREVLTKFRNVAKEAERILNELKAVRGLVEGVVGAVKGFLETGVGIEAVKEGLGRVEGWEWKEFRVVGRGQVEEAETFRQAETQYATHERDQMAKKQELESLESPMKLPGGDGGVDLGGDGSMGLLEGCFEHETGEYVYEVCFFGRATQRGKGGGGEVLLGTWSNWTGKDLTQFSGRNLLYTEGRFTGGAQCWNGPERSVTVKLECGAENAVVRVDEPGKCEYEARVTTPALCEGEGEGEGEGGVGESEGEGESKKGEVEAEGAEGVVVVREHEEL
ncbi:hypothetical protein HDU67_006841 [Dinochytrium kinnereticum]|nr:hypothetical protein HDU67_006841 [Dinochytrium kinnereticum]